MVAKIPADPSSPNCELLSCHVPLLLATSKESPFGTFPAHLCLKLLLTQVFILMGLHITMVKFFPSFKASLKTMLLLILLEFLALLNALCTAIITFQFLGICSKSC